MTKFEEELKRPANGPLTELNNNMRDERTTFDSNGMAVEPKLQQQALPVVPEFVAEWIEILKTKGLKPLKNPETYGETGFTEEKLQNIVFWISERQEDYMRAWLDGYTVEKPQLFYLKNKLTGLWLMRYEIVDKVYPYDHTSDIRNRDTFTQQEIDSMETGSYEKIEVEK